MQTASSELASALWERTGGQDILLSAAPAVRERLAGAGDMPSAEAVLTSFDGRDLLAFLAEQVRAGSGRWTVSLGTVIGMLIVMSIWKRYRDTVHDSGSGQMFSLLCTASLALTCFSMLWDRLKTVTAAASSIHTVMTAAAGTLTALTAARGMVLTASSDAAGMALLLTAMESVTAGLLLPFVRVTAGFSLASVFDRDGTLGCVGRLLRGNFLFLTGALMTLLTAVLACQRVLAQTADSLSLRTAKAVLSGAVPVIGGAVGDAASAVGAALSLTQKTAGAVGIAVILWQLLPPVLSVFGFRLLMTVCACAAELLTLDGEAKLLHEAEALAGFLCAVLSAEAVFYLLMISLCMKG